MGFVKTDVPMTVHTVSAQIEGHSRLEQHVSQIQILGHLEILGN